ncbi:MAG: CoA transferase [Deltaproteobacteria bacterium]|nr:CoA transferase [Deltaproteobacteria bacterium]
MREALKGVRVVDFTRVLSGPFCTAMLADMGAEVIKIEGPKGGADLARLDNGVTINGEALYFMTLNRNKKGIQLNLKKKEGIEIVKKLVKISDVVVENNRPGVMEKLGIAYEDLKKINPSIIYAAISGFGRKSPFEHHPAFDIVAQAMSGIMSVNGFPENPPTKVGVALGDTASAIYTAFGIVVALYARKVYGIGQYIDVSMVDSIFSLLDMNLLKYLANGEVPTRIGSRHPTSYPFDAFEASDGYFVIGTATEKAFSNLCAMMGKPELHDQEEFKTDKARSTHADKLKPIIEQWSRQFTVEQVLEKLNAAMVPAGPVYDIGRIAESEHVKVREMLAEIDHPVAGKVKVVATPVKLSETPAVVTRPSPLLGQHTEQVLEKTLGYTRGEIETLKAQNVI